jgi:hypothetical protein
MDLGVQPKGEYLCGVNEVEQKVLETLLELDRVVEQMPAANPKPDLMPIFSRLEELTNQLPPTTDRQLLHYLHRKSYQKARACLEERRVL